MLNTARLAERWREAVRMAAALGEELAEEDNRLMTKTDLQAAVAELEARLYWRLLVGAASCSPRSA